MYISLNIYTVCLYVILTSLAAEHQLAHSEPLLTTSRWPQLLIARPCPSLDCSDHQCFGCADGEAGTRQTAAIAVVAQRQSP